jgi:hypothetical protein
MRINVNTFLATLALVVGSVSIASAQHDKETIDSACLMKSSSEWAGDCEQCLTNDHTYRINLSNICEKTIDVRLAVQEKTMRWKVFNFIKLGPGESVTGYACNGTGRYVFWSRDAGDASIVFPNEREIESQFNR